VIDYLLAALEKWDDNNILEIGGPEVITYQGLMFRYARIRGHRRGFFLLPYIPVGFMAFGIGLITPVPRRIARALVGGLSHDSIVTHKNAHETHPEVELMDFESATREALTCLHPLKIERVWESDFGSLPEYQSSHCIFKKTSEVSVQTLKHEGFFIDHRRTQVDTEPEKVFQVIERLAEYFVTRQFAVDVVEANHLLLLRSLLKAPGEAWFEWRVVHVSSVTSVTQTVFFAPRGLAGFAYWFLLYPFRVIGFHWLVKNIVRRSKME
jgi:hypothetical protein